MKKEDYNKFYIQGSDHYLIPKDVFIELFEEMENWREEAKELKEQLKESKDNYNCLLKQKEQFEYIMSKQVDYQGQQKEFIKYLNSYIDLLNYKPNILEEAQKDILKEILSKYKNIIGGKE